jgi:hypothetical protein
VVTAIERKGFKPEHDDDISSKTVTAIEIKGFKPEH